MRRTGYGLPAQPEQTLGGSVLAGLQFVQHKVLESLGLGGGCQQPILDFLQSELTSGFHVGDEGLDESWMRG